ncbi:MAG: glycosyltransferase [Planctomycetes bacterium]|nr:glycosyltransferase [Planctomycetota bacterium]
MRISLVIPTLNAGPLLDDVLAGVLAQRDPGFDELIAIDSGSTDGTVERLQRAGFRVASIDKREFDHGRTRDRGIALTTGDIVVLLVQDATPQGADWLGKMVAPFADPQIAGVWSRQIPREKCQPIMKRRILGWPGWGDGVTKKALPEGKQLRDLPPFEQLFTCAFDNVASAMRRSVWQRFPLGPRRFGEDIWFGKRVIEAGLAIAHQGSAIVMHSHDRTAWAEGKRTFCDHRNLHRLFGLVGIPTREALDGAIVHATKEHCDYVRSLGLPVDEEVKALKWTTDYVKWQCWGQFVGAKAGADLPGPEGMFLRLLGKRLERGIG